jgi:hypothetical protein
MSLHRHDSCDVLTAMTMLIIASAIVQHCVPQWIWTQLLSVGRADKAHADAGRGDAPGDAGGFAHTHAAAGVPVPEAAPQAKPEPVHAATVHAQQIVAGQAHEAQGSGVPAFLFIGHRSTAAASGQASEAGDLPGGRHQQAPDAAPHQPTAKPSLLRHKDDSAHAVRSHEARTFSSADIGAGTSGPAPATDAARRRMCHATACQPTQGALAPGLLNEGQAPLPASRGGQQDDRAQAEHPASDKVPGASQASVSCLAQDGSGGTHAGPAGQQSTAADGIPCAQKCVAWPATSCPTASSYQRIAGAFPAAC